MKYEVICSSNVEGSKDYSYYHNLNSTSLLSTFTINYIHF